MPEYQFFYRHAKQFFPSFEFIKYGMFAKQYSMIFIPI
nr:MAG TPA: hypothetical protein [Caudoviricetes sp.]